MATNEFSKSPDVSRPSAPGQTVKVSREFAPTTPQQVGSRLGQIQGIPNVRSRGNPSILPKSNAEPL